MAALAVTTGLGALAVSIFTAMGNRRNNQITQTITEKQYDLDVEDGLREYATFLSNENKALRERLAQHEHPEP